MASASRLPNFDRLSVLIATILLAYTSARFVNLPPRDFGVQLPGFYLGFQLNANTVIGLLVAGLAGSGTLWLIRDHKSFTSGLAIQHLILPSLTALVIGVPLNNLPLGTLWWSVFIMGGLILSAVLTAEYITIDPEDIRQPAATGVLTALSFALFLILAISLRATEVRLLLLLPPLLFSSGLVSLRTMHLRLQGRWLFAQAVGVALIVGQVAAALHYLPVHPIAFGLYLLGLAYALTVFFSNLAQQNRLIQAASEPIFVLVVAVVFALWL
jgi:hypothetical protein